MSKLGTWDILKAPVVTEKSVLLKEATSEEGDAQVLTFRVDKKADKNEIRDQLREKKAAIAVLRSEARSSAEDARRLAQEQMRKIADEIKILVAETRRSN